MGRNRQGQRRWWAWGLVMVWILGSAAQARLTMRDLRAQRIRTYHQRRTLFRKLKGVKQQQRQISQELQIAQIGWETAQNDLRRTRQRLSQTESRLAAVEAELKKIESQLQQHSEELWKRLNVFYQRGTLGYLEVVVGATDFTDFLNRTVLLRTVVRGDMALLRQIQAEQRKRDALKEALRVQREELQRLHQEQALHERLIRVQVARKRALLTSLVRDRLTYERSLVELEETRRQIESLISRFSRPRSLSVGKKFRAGGTGSLLGAISYRLSWPVAGRFTDGFGYRIHPVWKTRRFHDGVDLAAPAGTTIRAAAAGRVIHSGWMGAYGRAIIVDHGNGLTTLYGHCSSLLVGVGAEVRKGQAIARVGSTGISTGNHVHFSTYLDGRAVNPYTVR
jgi:murein DD-endopeptidase MepM/ murein hydrolase activator NlpD